jgi:hypothetical protein
MTTAPILRGPDHTWKTLFSHVYNLTKNLTPFHNIPVLRALQMHIYLTCTSNTLWSQTAQILCATLHSNTLTSHMQNLHLKWSAPTPKTYRAYKIFSSFRRLYWRTLGQVRTHTDVSKKKSWQTRKSTSFARQYTYTWSHFTVKPTQTILKLLHSSHKS